MGARWNVGLRTGPVEGSLATPEFIHSFIDTDTALPCRPDNKEKTRCKVETQNENPNPGANRTTLTG